MTIHTGNFIYGLSPIKREDPKDGQSEWYYLDPRNASTFSDFKKIDVPSQNTPNPYAKEIQSYIFKTNPEVYKILYGNAEPEPAQNNQQPQAAQTENSGNIPSFSEQNANNIFPQPQSAVGQAVHNNVTQQPQVNAQNLTETIKSGMPQTAARIPDKNYIERIRELLGDSAKDVQDMYKTQSSLDNAKTFTTDEGGIVYDVQPTFIHEKSENTQENIGNQEKLNLFERAVKHLIDAEKPTNHTYIDTTWHRTVGIGANVDDWEKFKKVNWVVNGRPATENEKWIAYNKFTSDIEEGKKHLDANNKVIKNNKKASYYENYSNLRINEAEMDRLFRPHLSDDIRYLHKVFPNFDTFPENLKDVLLDIRFTTGNVSREDWPNLRKGIDNKNLQLILNNIHRFGVDEPRNVWAKQKIKDIKKW